MKPAPFAYHAPTTIREAAQLLTDLELPKLLAGGQSLMPMLNMRYVFTENIVDLNRVTGLDGIALADGVIEIGAMTRQRLLLRDPLIAEHMSVLQEALHLVGHVATRARGTIGGSLSHLDPAAELPAILALHDGILVVQDNQGEREIAAADWFQGYMTPALEPHEILVSVKLPVWTEPHGYAFMEIARRHGDFAMAGAGALLAMDGGGIITRAAVIVFGVEVAPVRLHDAETCLIGQKAGAELFVRAAAYAEKLEAMEDIHASSDYRRQVAAVMVRRVLEKAAARAEQK